MDDSTPKTRKSSCFMHKFAAHSEFMHETGDFPKHLCMIMHQQGFSEWNH